MKGWVKEIGLPAMVSAVVSALISPLVAGLINLSVTDQVNQRAKARDIKVAQILSFEASDDQLLTSINDFVQALSTQRNIADAQKKVHASVTQEIKIGEALRGYFSSGGISENVTRYESALTKFANDVDATKDVSVIGPWQESFDLVNEIRKQLRSKLIQEAQV